MNIDPHSHVNIHTYMYTQIHVSTYKDTHAHIDRCLFITLNFIVSVSVAVNMVSHKVYKLSTHSES